jgi:hypothetical protein
LRWSFLGVDLDDLSLWRSVHEDTMLDCSSSYAQFMISQRLMIHELRTRYLFSQFVRDIRTRDGLNWANSSIQIVQLQ